MFFKSTSLRHALPLCLALAGAASAGAAHAGGVNWSVGIYLPPPPMVVYRNAPAVVYAPAPEVVYAPRPVYGAPPVGYWREERREWCPPRYHGHHRHERWEGEREARWEREYHGGRY